MSALRQYSPTFRKNLLCHFLQDFVESNTVSDWLSQSEIVLFSNLQNRELFSQSEVELLSNAYKYRKIRRKRLTTF